MQLVPTLHYTTFYRVALIFSFSSIVNSRAYHRNSSVVVRRSCNIFVQLYLIVNRIVGFFITGMFVHSIITNVLNSMISLM